MPIVIVTVIIILVVICGPLLIIWALNTLFGLSIAYTISTWLAAGILGGVVGGTSVPFSK